MLKKAERKEKLIEIYATLRNGEQNETVKAARKLVLSMLGHDGVFILDKDLGLAD